MFPPLDSSARSRGTAAPLAEWVQFKDQAQASTEKKKHSPKVARPKSTVSDALTHRITVAIAYGSGPFSSHVETTPTTFIWSPFGSPFWSPKWIPYGLHFSLMPDLFAFLICFFPRKLAF